jgi:hypothetical protein
MSADTQSVAGLPRGWSATRQLDGVIQVGRSLSWRIITTSWFLPITLFWCGGTAIGFAKLIEREAEGRPMGTGGGWWVVLMVFPLGGIYLIAVLLWVVIGREEWHASHDRLEVHKRFLAWSWSRQFTHGSFRVTPTRDPRAGTTYSLNLRSGGDRFTLVSTGRFEELRSIGSLLAKQTGWDL